jgi:hypothetical protein
MKAVDTFCKSIVTAGIRDRFYRLNLVCGTGLSAALVPLFRGPSLGGTQFGNTTDTNVNFVAGDYVETGASGGLVGNGSSKYLQTGLQSSAWITGGNVRSHLSVYKRTSTSSGVLLSARSTALGNTWEFGAGGNVLGGTTGSVAVPGTHDSLLGVTRTNDTDLVSFRRTTLSAANAASASVSGTSIPFAVFARNDQSTGANAYTANLFSNQTLAGYSIGAGLNSSDISAYDAAMQAFQTALFRDRASSDPAFSAVTNAEAKLWIDSVYGNGGTVSTATAAAVNTFCNSIESAGLRSLLWRANPMAGENLSAALVPLYRGPSSGGTQYGNATDTNDNFVSGDYVATSGLIGNGSTKRLRTGLPLNFSSARHIGCFVHTLPTATFRAYLGGTGATGFSGLFRLTNVNPVTNYALAAYNEASGAGGSGGTSVHAAGDFVLGAQAETGGAAVCYTNGTLSGIAGVGRNSGTVTTGISVFAEAQGGGTFSSHSNARLGGYTIGDNLSESESLAYYNIWDTLVRALGRK